MSAVGDAGDQIRRLMARGLDLYALGQVEEATACWRRVLALDPRHAEARDYLSAAGGDAEPGAAAAPAASGEGRLLGDALAQLRVGRVQEGFELLETLAQREPPDLDAHAFLELARGTLLRSYRQRAGNGESVPHVLIPPAQVMKYNLPAAAGFVLSLIDGKISLDELLAVSGMDSFDALRAFTSLLDAGIVGARP